MPLPGSGTLPSSSLLPGTSTATTPTGGRVLPPLELAVEITLADGAQIRWDSGKDAASIPQQLSFRTRRGDGFADANITLPRRIDRDYVDLNLLDSVVISGAEGSVAYEGRVTGLPRSFGQAHSVTVQTSGWMTHTRSRKMSEVYVDRDLSRWQPASTTRHAALVTAGYTLDDVGVEPDVTNGLPGVAAKYLLDGRQPMVEAFYDAGPGNLLGAIYYDWTSANIPAQSTDPLFHVRVGFSSDDAETSFDSIAVNATATSGAGTYAAPNAYRYGVLQNYYTTAASSSPSAERLATFRKVAVYGDQGLDRHGPDPAGVYASDVIRHIIAKYCPLLNTAGVQDTTYPIPHLVFRDRVDPYDALLEINKYHLWQLGVYENRTLFYHPVDMSDYDWEVRISDPGVSLDLQGDTSEDLANGVVVTYTDVAKGTTNSVTPADYPELADASPDNPVNAHGETQWIEITLSTPTTLDAALQTGAIALAEHNQAKAPGTITVQGHIRDRTGHWQPCWAPRAGDRIAITDHPNDRARLIVETDYQHDSHTLQIAVDSTFKKLDAVLDRLAGAVSAAGLSS